MASDIATMGSTLQSSLERPQLHEDPLQPLRAMAERVGKEVEDFAERLDTWFTQSNENEKSRHKATVKVVGRFRDIAESNVRELKQQHSIAGEGGLDETMKRRIKHMAQNEGLVFGQPLQTTATSSSAQELRNWQAELATWELVRVVFDHYHPEPGTNPEVVKKVKLATVGGRDHRSPKSEVWERFIISDDRAREKKVILKWLQQTAKNSERNVDSILEQWAKESGKDINTWTSGWLETRATIKHAKRVQGVEGPLDPTATLSGRHADKPLVTRLDPDAQTRQQGALEKPDVYYEHALWMACYEMLRRGEPFSKINEWLKDRNQGFRAICIGASGGSQPEGAPNMGPHDFGYLFRRTTYLAAQSTSYPYEGAAFGLVSGNFKKIQAISTSWDDHLYAYYNALLLSRFDSYLLTEPKDKPRAQKHPRFNFPGVMEHFNNDWENATQKVVELLKHDKTTSEQAKTPIKLIQSALLTGTLDELVHKIGIAIADSVQAKSSRSTFIIDPDHSADAARAAGPDGVFSSRGKRSVVVEDYHQAFLQDAHALRILVHVFIILGNPRDPLTRQQRSMLFARGNVIAAYVELLRLTQRLQPIPLYAAQLEKWRASMTLARILPEISDRNEQKRCVGLMKGYGVDVEATLLKYFDYVMGQTGLVTGVGHEVIHPISRYEILDKPSKGPTASLWPNGQHLKDQIVGSITRREDDAVVESLLWYDHLEDKNEDVLSTQVAKALAVFLLTGRLGSAEKLVIEISVGTEHDLSHFVRLIALFDQWRTEEIKFIRTQNTNHNDSTLLKDILEAITAEISAILEPPYDPRQTDVWPIYRIYVPEMILAYLVVLHAGSLFLRREYAIVAMDLTVTLAQKEWLSTTFQEAKRMRELVDRIADVSRSMVELGEKQKVKMTKEGKTVHIWNLGRQN